MNPELMKFVEWLLCRNIHFSVTSALRTVAQNESCNGSLNSQHLTGDAIDLAPIDLPIGVFFSTVEGSPFVFDQLIRYRTFIHISFARGRKPRQMKLNFTDRK
nr:MAG TPA: peptidase [Microviridae sp.]